MAFDCLFHDMAEKLGAPMTSLESSAFCNFREVLPDGGGIGLLLRSSGLTWTFFCRE
jgi:hypothetical protein